MTKWYFTKPHNQFKLMKTKKAKKIRKLYCIRLLRWFKLNLGLSNQQMYMKIRNKWNQKFLTLELISLKIGCWYLQESRTTKTKEISSFHFLILILKICFIPNKFMIWSSSVGSNQTCTFSLMGTSTMAIKWLRYDMI